MPLQSAPILKQASFASARVACNTSNILSLQYNVLALIQVIPSGVEIINVISGQREDRLARSESRANETMLNWFSSNTI